MNICVEQVWHNIKTMTYKNNRSYAIFYIILDMNSSEFNHNFEHRKHYLFVHILKQLCLLNSKDCDKLYKMEYSSMY